jgi:hypothetical protein
MYIRRCAIAAAFAVVSIGTRQLGLEIADALVCVTRGDACDVFCALVKWGKLSTVTSQRCSTLHCSALSSAKSPGLALPCKSVLAGFRAKVGMTLMRSHTMALGV